jgi:hypothetical protein
MPHVKDDSRIPESLASLEGKAVKLYEVEVEHNIGAKDEENEDVDKCLWVMLVPIPTITMLV